MTFSNLHISIPLLIADPIGKSFVCSIVRCCSVSIMISAMRILKTSVSGSNSKLNKQKMIEIFSAHSSHHVFFPNALQSVTYVYPFRLSITRTESDLDMSLHYPPNTRALVASKAHLI